MMASISLEEARKLLGEEDSAKLNDDQLQKLIWDLEAIASVTIEAMINNKMTFDSGITSDKSNVIIG